MVEDDKGLEPPDDDPTQISGFPAHRFELKGIVEPDGQRTVVAGFWVAHPLEPAPAEQLATFFLTPDLAGRLRKALEDLEWWGTLP